MIKFGNMIKCEYKYSFYVVWREYNEYGNLVYYKNNKGLEECREYNEHSDVIHQKDEEDNESWWEYNKRGNCIYYKDNKGNEIKNPFNVEGTSNSYDKV